MLDIDQERRLFKRNWRYFGVCLPLLLFLNNAANNAVFYAWSAQAMYEQRPLPDVLLAEDPSVVRLATGVRLGAIIMMWVTFVGALAFPCAHSTVLVLRRFICVYAVASALRLSTLFVTLLPATSYYCIAPHAGGTYRASRAPRTAWDVLTQVHWKHNCGDFLFSGHTSLMVCVWLTVELCMAGYWQRWASAPRSDGSRSWARKFVAAQILGVYGMRMKIAIFLYNTPRARKHYTIDVLVAFYVTCLLWNSLAVHFPTTLDDERAATAPPLLPMLKFAAASDVNANSALTFYDSLKRRDK